MLRGKVNVLQKIIKEKISYWEYDRENWGITQARIDYGQQQIDEWNFLYERLEKLCQNNQERILSKSANA